ncbi:MAG: hypothetical protein JNK15_24915 [Planctomycetes bacterium]|nr:hypothetical protein [Planctomycetota bacterium]
MILRFAPSPAGPKPNEDADPRPFRPLLLVAAAIVAIASLRPWLQVQFVRLFGEHDGPPGWHSSAGFTCLCTSMLVAVLACSESRAIETQRAARPGSLLLVLLATLAVGCEWWQGPGLLRGVSARWTVAFWLVLAASVALLFACVRRFELVRRR